MSLDIALRYEDYQKGPTRMMSSLLNRLRRIFEPDEFTSLKLRKRFRKAYRIEIGLYSYGCFDATRIGRNTTIGRYCSFAPTSYIFRRNHGLEFIGLTPYLYNQRLGVVEEGAIPFNPLIVEDDVWFGHNSIVLPSVNFIGRGSVVAAGAVVTRDVPAYSIVAGNPAKVLRFRFPEDVILDIEKSCWWKMTPNQLKVGLRECPAMYFTPARHFTNSNSA